MGNFIYNSQKEHLIEGVNKELKDRTISRIRETLKLKNGILCNNCKVALIPITKNKCPFPTYCNFCNKHCGIQGSYGLSDFSNQEDKWLPESHNKNDIRITLNYIN